MLLAAAVGLKPAAAQEAAAQLPQNVLRIIQADGARPIFDSLIAAITAPGRLALRPEIKTASPQAALQAFCENAKEGGPDIVLTTQRMSAAVAADCEANGIKDPVAVELGRNPLVLAVRSGSALARLSSQQVYLALARDVPYKEEFHRNVAIRWSDIDRSLPPLDIRFQLPPRADGSRAAFDMVVLAAGCRGEKLAMQIAAAAERMTRCTALRADRVREIPRDQAVRALLDGPEGTVGVLSLREVEQSEGGLVGVELDGVPAERGEIGHAVLDHAHSVWLYARRNDAALSAAAPGGFGLSQFGLHSFAQGYMGQDAPSETAPPPTDAAVAQIIELAQSDAIIGPAGPLAQAGMLPLPDDERAAQRAALAPRPATYGIAWAMDWTYSIAYGAWYVLETTFQRNRGAMGPGASDLSGLMDLAGYKLKEFQSSIGIVPGATMTFGIAREMSEADRDALDRALRLDSRARTDAVSAIQRRVVRTVLDVGQTEGYVVSTVELTVFPLPEIRLVVSAAGAEK